MISAELIERRLKNFWGYGSLEAPVWFVGMEDGLGKLSGPELRAELLERFRAADGRQTVDMRLDMKNVGTHMAFYSGPNAKLQRTFIYPIGLYLYLKHRRRPESPEIRFHQGVEFGDINKKLTMSLDIMPLPSRAMGEEHWLYAACGVPGLGSKRQYLETYLGERTAGLRTLVETHRPRLVVFYATSKLYRDAWQQVITSNAREVTKGMYFAKAARTSFCMLPHGVSHGMSYDRVYEFANKIAGEVDIE